MPFYLSLVPIIIVFIIILTAPVSLDDENKKRTAKGKQAFTEVEFTRNIKRSRIIASIILGLSVLTSVAIYNFA